MISACLVIYNEDKRIQRCLDQLAGIADEILIVHDGECRDKSIEIAKKYTSKIFIKEHIGIAEPHRAFLYNQAKGDYILIIDADEILSSSLASFLREKKFNFDALKVPWIEKSKRDKYKLILFKKDKMHFIGFPQAEAFSSGKIKVLPNAPLINDPGFLVLSRQSWLKQKKWIKIHARYYLTDFKSLPSFQFEPYYPGWKRKQILRSRYALIFFPAKAVYIVLKNIFSFSMNYKENLSLGAIASIYYFLLGWQITILRLSILFGKKRPN